MNALEFQLPKKPRTSIEMVRIGSDFGLISSVGKSNVSKNKNISGSRTMCLFDGRYLTDKFSFTVPEDGHFSVSPRAIVHLDYQDGWHLSMESIFNSCDRKTV
jgi:hypothetical protein